MKIILPILLCLFLTSCYQNNVVFSKYAKEKYPQKVYPTYIDRGGSHYPPISLNKFKKRKNKALLSKHFERNKGIWAENMKILKFECCTDYNLVQEKIIQGEADSINELVRNKKFTSVTFIMVGFNNKYDSNGKDTASSNVKLDKLISLIDSVKPTSKTLFVKLYWDGKYDKDLTGTMKNLSYAAANSYYVGFSLRRLIMKLECKNINFISHSLGANIVCEAIFNQETKATNRGGFLTGLNELHKDKSIFIKNKNIRAALIAPAMPGSTTFTDFFNNQMNESLNTKNVHFLIGYSEYDKALSKINKKRFAKRFGSTTLGCDINEVIAVVDSFRTHNLITNLDTISFNNNPIKRGLAETHDLENYLKNRKAYSEVINFLFNDIPRIEEAKEVEKTVSQSLFDDFKKEYVRLYKETYLGGEGYSDNKAIKNAGNVLQNINYRTVNRAAYDLLKILLKQEGLTYYNEKISPATRRLISHVAEPYVMVLLERALNEKIVKDNINVGDTTYFFTNKIVKELSHQQNLMMTNKYPYYTFETKHKRMLKFFSIRVGNDLFQLIQDNKDRDYTGSLLVEFGTDYLNPLRRRPIKSYQTLIYGFDVFTPSFRDTSKFKKSNDYDSLDRPHGSFNYFGWSKKGLSKYNKLRWATTIKLGKIGGRIGDIFQTTLHQDISYSLRPKGWDAQIAKGGRLGISFETKHEYQFYLNDNYKNSNSMKNLNVSPFIETKIGTYMTNGSFGLQFSNKKFFQTNHNFINQRTKQGVYNFLDHLMYNASFKVTRVIHNTMLEGYGIYKTTDQDTVKNDKYTPRSVYVLQYDQIIRWTYTANVTLSYTTRYGTIFYNWFAFSAETKLGNLRTDKYPYSEDINLDNRWQHFAEIGLTFNIH